MPLYTAICQPVTLWQLFFHTTTNVPAAPSSILTLASPHSYLEKLSFISQRRHSNATLSWAATANQNDNKGGRDVNEPEKLDHRGMDCGLKISKDLYYAKNDSKKNISSVLGQCILPSTVHVINPETLTSLNRQRNETKQFASIPKKWTNNPFKKSVVDGIKEEDYREYMENVGAVAPLRKKRRFSKSRPNSPTRVKKDTVENNVGTLTRSKSWTNLASADVCGETCRDNVVSSKDLLNPSLRSKTNIQKCKRTKLRLDLPSKNSKSNKLSAEYASMYVLNALPREQTQVDPSQSLNNCYDKSEIDSFQDYGDERVDLKESLKRSKQPVRAVDTEESTLRNKISHRKKRQLLKMNSFDNDDILDMLNESAAKTSSGLESHELVNINDCSSQRNITFPKNQATRITDVLYSKCSSITGQDEAVTGVALKKSTYVHQSSTENDSKILHSPLRTASKPSTLNTNEGNIWEDSKFCAVAARDSGQTCNRRFNLTADTLIHEYNFEDCYETQVNGFGKQNDCLDGNSQGNIQSQSSNTRCYSHFCLETHTDGLQIESSSSPTMTTQNQGDIRDGSTCLDSAAKEERSTCDAQLQGQDTVTDEENSASDVALASSDNNEDLSPIYEECSNLESSIAKLRLVESCRICVMYRM